MALRAPRLGVAELTTDEAFSWRMAAHGPAEIVARTARDVHPPLYYLVLKAWVGVWGDSPAALRSLSVTLGLAVVLLAYGLCLEANAYARGPGDGRSPALHGAVVAAVLVAVHADQVGHSRHARMYAMGAALAGLSAWLMLRALRSERRALGVWVCHGVAASALCYTHYYGLFTVAAQLLFAAAVLADRWREARRRPHGVLGMMAAVLVATTLFAPWISVVVRQTAVVSEGYWIGEMGSADIVAALTRWAAGVEWWPPGPVVPILVLGLFAGAILGALWRGDRGLRFFALQAALPWLGALALSLVAGRPLVLERYLSFSQIALLAGLGYTWGRLAGPWVKGMAALAVGSVMAIGLAQDVGAHPTSEAVAAEVARFLARHVGPQDLVVANSPRTVNVLHYYLRREGAAGVRVQSPASRSVGILSQVVAASPDEIVADEHVWADGSRKVWWVRLHPPRRWQPEPPPPDWRPVFSRWFEGAGGTRVLVMTYARGEAGGPGP